MADIWIMLVFALVAQLGVSYQCCAFAELCRMGQCCGSGEQASCCVVDTRGESSPQCCPMPSALERENCECCKNAVPASRKPVEGVPASTTEIVNTLQLLAVPAAVHYEMPRGAEAPRTPEFRPPPVMPTGRRMALTCIWRE